MAEDWYYMTDGNRNGPVPTAKLKELATSGQLQPTDMLWREGMAEWAPASKMKGLWAGGVATAPSPSSTVAQSKALAKVSEDAPSPSRGVGRGFTFDGGAGSYFVVGILTYLINAITFGIAFPWAMCMYQRWVVEHTLIEGRRLRFVGTGGELFVLWLKWFFLTLITLGIYMFWIVPALNRWIVERTEFERG